MEECAHRLYRRGGERGRRREIRDYFDHHEPISTTPSHRALAMFRGRNEGVLQLSLNADPQFDEPPKESHCEQIIIDHLGLRLNNAPADSWRKGGGELDLAHQGADAPRNRADGHRARARRR